MFTGIIKATGVIAAMKRRGGDVSMRVVSPALPWADYAAGESIAVNGVCLTIV
ncbi:MAG: riboflavin synthase, partial [Proteobacteria bacterium]|nr:riboflavin synthase [Pseudomonadota bacterium]